MALSGPHNSRWTPPERKEHDVNGIKGALLLYNSFTDRKEYFVPHEPAKASDGRRRVKWYSCGPTVYDSAHLGHSRNYMTIDILRRVMEDYFDFDVTFVMNITDVDDKIVLRARRNYLLQQYQKDMCNAAKRQTDPAAAVRQVHEDASNAVQQSLAKQQQACNSVKAELDALQSHPNHGAEANGKIDAGEQHRKEKRLSKKAEEVSNTLQEEHFKVERLLKAQQQLENLKEPQNATETGLMLRVDVGNFMKEVLLIAGDEIALWQDNMKGASVTDLEIYKKHAERYEAEFWEDMKRLGMRIPEEGNLTRVTEYMEDIIAYIEKIIENGFAYTQSASGKSGDNNSVYFDTQAYMRSGHAYPKLSPWAGGSAALASAGESNFVNSEKRSGRDFALWKASKPGEPYWPSPWGHGRPGWHIECSAMASKLLGQKMDIHTGGVDLRFPHHDNELAQAEAHYHQECGCGGQWVNYFLHSGHLNINGLKMSKSLKNFYTIREILDQSFSATQLRLMFAMQPWNKEMNFVFSAKPALQKRESTLKHFFNNVGMLLPKDAPQEKGNMREQQFNLAAREKLLDTSQMDLSRSPDQELAAGVNTAADRVHSSLLDNINTGAALDALLDLVAATNKYMKQREEAGASTSEGGPPNTALLRMAAGYVEGILRVLGITTIGLHLTEALSASSQQLLSVFRDFRDSVSAEPQLRQVCSSIDLDDPAVAQSQPAAILDLLTSFRSQVRVAAKKAKAKHALEESDRMRDDVMVDLGVRMEDKADGSSVWMADDPETLQEERRERQERVQQEALNKAKKAVEVKTALLEKVERQAQQPSVQEALKDDYSRFNGEGQDANPTHDKEGNELKGGALKKGKSKADSCRKQRAFYEKQLGEKGPHFLDDLRSEVSQAAKEYQELESRFRRLEAGSSSNIANGSSSRS